MKTIDSIEMDALSRGKLFAAYLNDSALASGANLDMRVTTPAALDALLVVRASAAAAGQIRVYEAATISVGTAATEYNLRRIGTPATAAIVVTTAPTVTATGTATVVDRIIVAETAEAFVYLKKGTEYLVRLTNHDAGAQPCGIALEWVE